MPVCGRVAGWTWLGAVSWRATPRAPYGKRRRLRTAWSGSVTRDSGNIALHTEQVNESGIKVVVDVTFQFVSPHIDADLGLKDGEVGDSELRMRGLRAVSLDIKAGGANGTSDNLKQKVEIPISLNAPVIVAGIAMNVNVRFKFLVTTAFSAKNSTISAHGAWETKGPLAYDKTSGQVSVQMPTITEKVDLVKSLQGISVGATGFVFATDIRFMLGLGIPAANAGPYVRLVTSVGLALGSDIGLLCGKECVKCHGTTVVINGAVGAGISISDSVARAINEYVKRVFGAKQKVVEEDAGKDLLLKQIFEKSFVPDTPICNGGAVSGVS